MQGLRSLDKTSHQVTLSIELERKFHPAAMGLLSVFLFALYVVLVATARKHDSEKTKHPEHTEYMEDGSRFILGKPVSVVKTDEGEVRVLTATEGGPLRQHNVALVFITMEPKVLSLPMYIDSQLLLVVQQGNALLSFVHAEKLITKRLKSGDVYALSGGVVHYTLNSHESQQLKMMAILDTSTAFLKGRPQTYFIGGGVKPAVVLSGFSTDVLSASFKVSPDQLARFLRSQRQGPFVRTSVDTFLTLATDDDKNTGKKHDDKVFNLFDSHAFDSEHGWVAWTFSKVSKQLQQGRFQVLAAHLNSSSLLAPHWNPRGSEFGIVTRGRGNLQISFPNGTRAADEELDVGTVFYIPQFLPSCQVAAKTGDGALEFLVFTVEDPTTKATGADDLQFLAGQGSALKAVDIHTLSLSFDVPEQLLRSLLEAQKGSVILPGLADSEEPSHKAVSLL